MTEKTLDDYLQEVTKGTIKGEETEEQKIKRFMDKLNLTEIEAIELIAYDKNEVNELSEIEKNKKVEYINRKIKERKEGKIGGSKVSDDEIRKLHDILINLKASDTEPFNDWFKSKDLNSHVADFLQPRQIRFRLDKLEKEGYIQSKSTKPKTYKLLG